ncbi:MAG TPA: hypothetical protein PLN56_04020 [Methanoregulaceae archaeon]|nr:MAG: hypothetical protein IPI71_08275 [Methanolinea sp.]HON81246.1 hypothetical protein [Methanoregulaceae archaeon]HPD10148.1 hypothetical protein [Methanoregulaceae archaeon]HRT15154.1 hypothetical protein [Methanoregulaceae archaeon]HRU30729.1 hypothetical protein [Methanoregulaceae archaeon]
MDRNTVGLISATALFVVYAIFAATSSLPPSTSPGNWSGLSIVADGVILILLGYGVFYFWSVRT